VTACAARTVTAPATATVTAPATATVTAPATATVTAPATVTGGLEVALAGPVGRLDRCSAEEVMARLSGLEVWAGWGRKRQQERCWAPPP
jgi:hypothetical protein